MKLSITYPSAIKSINCVIKIRPTSQALQDFICIQWQLGNTKFVGIGIYQSLSHPEGKSVSRYISTHNKWPGHQWPLATNKVLRPQEKPSKLTGFLLQTKQVDLAPWVQKQEIVAFVSFKPQVATSRGQTTSRGVIQVSLPELLHR